MIKTITIVVLGIIIGGLIAFPISKILIKRNKKKIVKNSVEKILNQKEANFQTLEGKPINLKFINDGKEVDLKKEVTDELAKTKLREIKGYEEKVKEIKKSKKVVKKIKKKK